MQGRPKELGIFAMVPSYSDLFIFSKGGWRAMIHQLMSSIKQIDMIWMVRKMEYTFDLL